MSFDRSAPLQLTIRTKSGKSFVVTAWVISEVDENRFTVRLDEPLTIRGRMIEFLSVVDGVPCFDELNWNTWV